MFEHASGGTSSTPGGRPCRVMLRSVVLMSASESRNPSLDGYVDWIVFDRDWNSNASFIPLIGAPLFPQPIEQAQSY